MKALTVRQPWAWAIAHGKDIENRDWPTRVRGVIAIHAAKGMTRHEYEDNKGFIESNAELMPLASEMIRGAVIGTVELVDCVQRHPSVWFEGEYGFVLKNFKPCEPVYCNGALGFWEFQSTLEILAAKQKE